MLTEHHRRSVAMMAIGAIVGGLLLASTVVAQEQAVELTPQQLLEIKKKKLAQAVTQDRNINQAGAASQGRIDALADDTSKLLAQYRAANQQIDTLKVYNNQLDKLVLSQTAEMTSMQRQIDSVVDVERGIRPLMEDMINALDQFVELDSPFLLEERKTRVANLRDLSSRADVSVGEVYRRIMEAWQIENDYGRAVDTYRSSLESGGQTKEVDFLKVGRVAYMYITLDGSEAGVWNKESGQWDDASDYTAGVKQALKMARKQAAFDLVTLPIAAPQEVN